MKILDNIDALSGLCIIRDRIRFVKKEISENLNITFFRQSFFYVVVSILDLWLSW